MVFFLVEGMTRFVWHMGGGGGAGSAVITVDGEGLFLIIRSCDVFCGGLCMSPLGGSRIGCRSSLG
jgi:hypothetical protein